MKDVSSKSFRRVSKRAAEKMYNNDVLVYALACNMSPDNLYERPVLLGSWKIDEITGTASRDGSVSFETAVMYYEIYNCDYRRGRYAAYYVKRGGW